jgi:hypothetical protein
MFWSLSMQLMPGEEMIEDSTARAQSGIKPVYSIFLTNKRAIFRFDGLGSSMAQSFFYGEILSITVTRRLFLTYMRLKTQKKDFLLNVADADYWAARIIEIREDIKERGGVRVSVLPYSPERKRRDLLDMLTILRKNDLLTDDELAEKIHHLDTMRIE